MKNKWLYTFKVNREVNFREDSTETNDKGEEIKVSKTVKKSRPVLVRIKKPGRKLFDEGELYYGVKLSEGIKSGLLTRALLAKRYQNDGGSMSEPEKERYSELYLQLFEKENDLQRLQVNLDNISDEEKKDKITDLLIEMSELRRELQDFETAQSALFDQTAETRAKNKTIMWWVLQLAQIEKKNDEIKDYHWYKKEEEASTDKEKKAVEEEIAKLEFVNVFDGETLEDKMDKYDELEDGGDEFWQEALRKLAYFISYWYSGQADSEEDFQRVEEFLQAEENAGLVEEGEGLENLEGLEEEEEEVEEAAEIKELSAEEPLTEEATTQEEPVEEVLVAPEEHVDEKAEIN
tara:strand:- start:78267 stop:79313 length:1047 start_codon:yes stop_codon:yes gene_type:complete